MTTSFVRFWMIPGMGWDVTGFVMGLMFVTLWLSVWLKRFPGLPWRGRPAHPDAPKPPAWALVVYEGAPYLLVALAVGWSGLSHEWATAVGGVCLSAAVSIFLALTLTRDFVGSL